MTTLMHKTALIYKAALVHNIRLMQALIFVVLLASCASRPPPTDTFTNAKQYLSRIHSVVRDQRLNYLLKGVEQAKAQKKWSDVSILLNEISFERLIPDEKAVYLDAKAKAALARQEGKLVLNWLSTDTYSVQDWFDLASPSLQWSLIETKAQAYEIEHQYFEAARLLITSAHKQPAHDSKVPERQALHDHIWRLLTLVSQDTLETYQQTPSTEYVVQGWLDLAHHFRSHRALPTQARLIQEWKTLWPDHPASQPYPQALSAFHQDSNTASPETSTIQKIAVLLPLSGPYANVAQSIINGIMAAYYEPDLQWPTSSESSTQPPAPKHPIQLSFYDTQTAQSITHLYQQAVDAGAQMVIGPLEKKQVEALYLIGDFPVFTLVLNALPQHTAFKAHKNFFQFGLLIEDECEQIAEDAYKEGKQYAAMITSDTELGQRASMAFEQQWRTLNGTVVGRVQANAQTDIHLALKTLLGIEASERRTQALETRLGEKMYSRPYRRADLDFIFISVPTEIARQVKPTLAYYAANSLPVFSTAHIHEIFEDQETQADLSGVRFIDAPFVLNRYEAARQKTLSALPNRSLATLRLEAFGMDSYHLYQQLPLMITSNQHQFNGASGTLTLTPDQRIRRRAAAAIFENGESKILPDVQPIP